MSESTSSPKVLHAVLGTAGHIDHGKSSLVKALTGTDPDRFPEEQARGMTIDIGFAEYRTPDGIDVGLIDVPGHERFVRNMVAGAMGMDLVMLVVSADDSVMPQTREHLEIMALLGQKRGFVVISKVDKVPEDLVLLVEEEVSEFVKGTFLEGAPMIRCSTVSGQGVEDVKSEIDRLARGLPERDLSGVFRMPVNRSFTVKGHGTIVTGVPVSGVARVGDALEVLPLGQPCRVRGLQVHHRPAEEGGAGQRTALNLSDVNYRDIERGHVVATPGYYTATKLVEARFRLLSAWKGPIRDNLQIRFHAGCVEVLGTMALLDCKTLDPGDDALVQFRLEEPVVVAPGDHYLARQASPEKTLGGGIVLGETQFRFKRFRDWITENLEGKESSLSDRVRYLEYVIRSEGLHPIATDRLPLLVKDSTPNVAKHLEALRAEGAIVDLAAKKEVLHRDMVARGVEEAGKTLQRMHEADHYPFGFALPGIASAMKHPLPLVELFLATGVRKGVMETQDGLFRLKAFKGSISNEDRRLLGVIEEKMRAGGFSTPIPQDLADQLGKSKQRVVNVLTLLEGFGRVIKLDENVYLHRDSIREARDRFVKHCLEQGEMPSNAMKDVIGATRKFVIPLLEYFDKAGLSVRKESSRTLKSGYENVLV